MDEESEVERMMSFLIRHWKWIAGWTMLAAVAALIISLIVPPQYEATALIAAAHQRYQLQFDPRIPTVPDAQTPQPTRALPELAMADSVLNGVIGQLHGQLTPDDRTLANFERRLSARAGADPSLIRLSARSEDPQQAQTIANTWAKDYVAYVNDLYQQAASDEAFFVTQTAEARSTLETAEQALIDYQGRNPGAVIDAQLASKQAALTNYLSNNRTITLIIQDARSLQQQLARQKPDSSTALADELAALYLQVDALNSQTTVPIQLQIGGSGPLATRTTSEQASLLGTLVDVLQEKSKEIDQQITALGPDILALQQQQQQAQVELDRLTRDRDVARDTFQALARKLDEVKVGTREDTGPVQLASEAALPTEPIGPRKAVNTLLGAIIGLVLGIGAAYLKDMAWHTTARRMAAPAITGAQVERLRTSPEGEGAVETVEMGLARSRQNDGEHGGEAKVSEPERHS